MSQRVEMHFGNDEVEMMLQDDYISFTMAGLKQFLSRVEVSENYVEGQYGSDEVKVPLALLLRYAKGAKAEAETK